MLSNPAAYFTEDQFVSGIQGTDTGSGLEKQA